MSAPELKPCPFCGSNDISTGGGVRYAECRSCGAFGPTAHYPSSPREAWNERADLSPTLAAALAVPEVKALVDAAHAVCDAYYSKEGSYVSGMADLANALAALEKAEES